MCVLGGRCWGNNGVGEILDRMSPRILLVCSSLRSYILPNGVLGDECWEADREGTYDMILQILYFAANNMGE